MLTKPRLYSRGQGIGAGRLSLPRHRLRRLMGAIFPASCGPNPRYDAAFLGYLLGHFPHPRDGLRIALPTTDCQEGKRNPSSDYA
jgi:hypothetical protein